MYLSHNDLRCIKVGAGSGGRDLRDTDQTLDGASWELDIIDVKNKILNFGTYYREDEFYIYLIFTPTTLS